MFTRAYTKEQAVLKQSKAINKEFTAKAYAKAMIDIDEAYWSELEDNPGSLGHCQDFPVEMAVAVVTFHRSLCP